MEKKNLFQTAGIAVALMTALVAQSGFCSGPVAKDGNSFGRMILTVEDFSTFLGLSARDPSSAQVEVPDVIKEAGSIVVSVPQKALHSITAKVAKIKHEREVLAEQLESEVSSKKAEVRSKRREIQLSRTSAQEDKEAQLGVSLFANIVEEANIDASQKQKLAAFDRQNQIQLDYVSVAGAKMVSGISFGSDLVWSQASTDKIANR